MFTFILAVIVFAISLANFIEDSYFNRFNDSISTFRYILEMVVVCLLLFMLAKSLDNLSNPEAIDVYRGQTELRIETHYVDSVLVKSDTTVVWKNK